MAGGLTRDEVKQAVEECNNAIHSIDSDIGELDVIEDIRSKAAELHKVWETENGERTMIALSKVVDSLETYTDSLKRSMENIKNDTYTFTESTETEYKHQGEW